MPDIEGSWKPNDRPQSTIARNFSAALNDAFSIESSPSGNLKGLLDSVEQKKQAVTSRNQELEALEARLRETEERLKQKQSGESSPSGMTSANYSSHQMQPLGKTFSRQQGGVPQDMGTSSFTAQPQRVQPSTSKEISYRTPPMPGAPPQSPGVPSSGDQ